MISKLLYLEKKLKKSGFKGVIGLDEAGRGSLAGPVVAAAVNVCSPFNFINELSDIKDSKKISEKKRELIFQKIINCPQITWQFKVVSWKTIDQINILNATKVAMRHAVNKISSKMRNKHDYLLVDGNFKINYGIPELSIVKGDETVFSCMVAGIIAKVCRDRIMRKYSLKYPCYEFNRNKGYGTEKHLKNIKKYGLCDIHRKSFKINSKFL